MHDPHNQIADLLVNCRSSVAFTGAGISTESGIPDFRSPGGVWSQNEPVYYQDFLSSPTARHEYWRQKSLTHREFAKARPNVGHNILARWQQDGRLAGLITQNIDGLHQIAGSQQVVELHGTAREIACIDCGQRFGADEMVDRFLTDGEVPLCPNCEGRLKHATISFGQNLSPDVLEKADRISQEADLYFAIGSSLVVQPAAGLPVLAKRSGAKLVIINRDPTDLDSIADYVLNESIGAALTAIDDGLADNR